MPSRLLTAVHHVASVLKIKTLCSDIRNIDWSRMSASKLDRVTIGETSPTKQCTISAKAVQQFAELSGDFERIHVDEEFARATPYRRCIAHGILLLSQMSSGLLNEDKVGLNISYGYDRIRFIKPIFVGDIVTCINRIIEKRDDRDEVIVEEQLFNTAGDLAVITHHIYKFI